MSIIRERLLRESEERSEKAEALAKDLADALRSLKQKPSGSTGMTWLEGTISTEMLATLGLADDTGTDDDKLSPEFIQGAKAALALAAAKAPGAESRGE